MNPKFIPILIIPPLLGWLFLSLALRRSRLPLKNSLAVLFAPATGFTLISLSLFVCYAVVPQHARLLAVIIPFFLILMLMTFLSFKSGSRSTPESLLDWVRTYFSVKETRTPLALLRILSTWLLAGLFIYALAGFIGHLANYMTWNAFGGWDARYFWHLKSRFLFRDPEQWRLLFNETLRWGNNDYPLMVPGIITWGWHFVGRESLLWPMVVSLVFVCSLGAMILWYLAVWCSWLTALTAGIFFFTLPAYLFWGGTMYCDIPYAFFSNSAVLLLISALRLKDVRVLALSAFFAGCSAFTKNEGLVFLIWYVLLAGVSLGFEYRQSRRCFLRNLAAIACGLFLPLFICFYFKISLASGQVNLIGKSEPTEILAALTNWPRNRVILEGFRIFMGDPQNWNGLWLLLLAAAAYWPLVRKNNALPYSGMILLAILLINLGYALIFTITPHSIYKHIQTALMRLLLQTGALALVFIFETFGFKNKRVERSASGI